MEAAHSLWYLKSRCKSKSCSLGLALISMRGLKKRLEKKSHEFYEVKKKRPERPLQLRKTYPALIVIGLCKTVLFLEHCGLLIIRINPTPVPRSDQRHAMTQRYFFYRIEIWGLSALRALLVNLLKRQKRLHSCPETPGFPLAY